MSWEDVPHYTKAGVTMHTLPVQDAREHAPTMDCWCGPRVLWRGLKRIDVIHQAADGRPAVLPKEAS